MLRNSVHSETEERDVWLAARQGLPWLVKDARETLRYWRNRGEITGKIRSWHVRQELMRIASGPVPEPPPPRPCPTYAEWLDTHAGIASLCDEPTLKQLYADIAAEWARKHGAVSAPA